MGENVKMFNELDYSIKESELIIVIKGLKSNKAGLDGIRDEMLQVAIDVLKSKIFNDILLNETFPNLWRNGYIKCIYISGSKSITSNFRGITMCSNLSKVFIGILLNRLNAFQEKYNISKEEQIGF